MGVLVYKRVKNEKNAKKREGWVIEDLFDNGFFELNICFIFSEK